MGKRRSELWVLIALVVLLLSVSCVAQADELTNEILDEDKLVLYISSYSYSVAVVPQQLEGINKRFENQPIMLDVEFLDSKRFNCEENYEEFAKRLEFRLNKGLYYDAVIVGDDNGLDFLMTHKDALFPDTPIFFLGINDVDRATESSQNPQVVGVLESKSIKETIELAYLLNPKANRVILVKDNTNSSLGDYEEAISYEKDYPELEFETIDMSTMTQDEYFAEILQFTKDDLFFNLSAVTDISGNTMTYDELNEKHSQVLNTPLYGLTTVGLGDGRIGGKLVSHVEQGYAAADMVMSYFNGTPVEEMVFIPESPNCYMLDYQLVERFELDQKYLPEDVVYVNREFTFWEMYGLYIILAILIVGIELFIILLLIINIRARKRSQNELLESHIETQNVNEELTASIEELKVTNRELQDSISEVNQRDFRIKELIYTDKLTGLMSRFALKELVEEILTKDNGNGAILLFDIDNFKNINDAFGHEFGDKVLNEVGKRLKRIISKNINCCRFGGDEFIVVVTGEVDKKALLEKVKQVQDLFEETMEFQENKFFLNASIGVARFPDHGDTYKELLRNADIALNKSKSSGKDTSKIYDKTMERDFYEKIHLQNLIRTAFKDNEFYMNFQPIIEIESTRIFGYESLIRWKSQELGQVSPLKLIAEAEEMGLIIKLGEWIFRESCIFTKEINQGAKEIIYVSVNISASQLLYSEFVNEIIKIVEEIEVDPSYIVLEMTETTLIEDFEIGSSIIDRLRDYGFKIGLDDFGTGYSSLSYLKNFAIDILKIDKSFIDNIGNSAYDRYLVEAIIKIAKEKDIRTVAEGVENRIQYDILKELNCGKIQGYLFSKPLSIEDALNLTNDDIGNKL